LFQFPSGCTECDNFTRQYLFFEEIKN